MTSTKNDQFCESHLSLHSPKLARDLLFKNNRIYKYERFQDPFVPFPVNVINI